MSVSSTMIGALLLAAFFAIAARASGTTYCETYATTSATTYFPYPGSTVTVTIDGATTVHSTHYVYETPTPALKRAANTPPCDTISTVTRTEFTTVPNPTWTATWTEWATTVTGDPVTITVPAV